MQRAITLLLGLEVFLSGFSQTDSAAYSPTPTKHYFDWGNNLTEILLRQYGERKDIVIIHVHDDEFTSIEAAQKVLQHTGGLLIGIENKGKRLINFKKS